MPDLGQLLILLVVLLAAGAVVGAPLLRPASAEAGSPQRPDDDLGSLALRHRIAIESLRDVEADRRAGSLDPEAYAVARADAEERAARTRAALEAAEKDLPPPEAPGVARRSWRAAALVGGSVAILALIGTVLPAPVGLANGTVVNSQLAAQQQAEQERQAAIRQLEAQLAAKPQAAGMVQLANLYLGGGTARDYQHAADLLLLALRLDPKDADAYRLLITAYIQTADYGDATAATNAYAKVAPVSPDVPFFRGLIAYQGTGDRAAAIRWFDAFLKAAPDDARAPMVRSLRAEAAGQLRGASASPSSRPGS
jgi:cytochrome c-type biogenesis protein CcmH/NrfG